MSRGYIVGASLLVAGFAFVVLGTRIDRKGADGSPAYILGAAASTIGMPVLVHAGGGVA